MRVVGKFRFSFTMANNVVRFTQSHKLTYFSLTVLVKGDSGRIIVCRARCRREDSTVNKGSVCLQPLLGNATIKGTAVLFVVRSERGTVDRRRGVFYVVRSRAI
jgi:hypothetical protein